MDSLGEIYLFRPVPSVTGLHLHRDLHPSFLPTRFLFHKNFWLIRVKYSYPSHSNRAMNHTSVKKKGGAQESEKSKGRRDKGERNETDTDVMTQTGAGDGERRAPKTSSPAHTCKGQREKGTKEHRAEKFLS